jgi:hypothetical protein
MYKYSLIFLLMLACETQRIENVIQEASNETMYNPYPDGATIPCNICPLQISYTQRATTKVIVFDSTGRPCDSTKYFFNKIFSPSREQWQKWLAKGFKGYIEIIHKNIKHKWQIAEPIDRYIFYRKTLFNEDIHNMFIEERDLQSFSTRKLLESKKKIQNQGKNILV